MSFLTVVAALVGGFFALMIGLQVWMRHRARAMTGRPLPALPDAMDRRLRASPRALLYFFSPSCGACRPLTPRLREMSGKNPDVMLVDVSRDMEVARALGVMATPSVIEIADGAIAGYHIGVLPPEVAARFA